MSQLYDRIMTEGTHPWHFSDWPAREDDPSGRVPPRDELPRAQESLDPTLLEGAFVVSGDQVVRYLDSFRDVSTFDIIVNVAPPHPKMFLEFPCIGALKERHGLISWGVLIDSIDFEEQGWDMEGARWGLTVRIVMELRRGYICGPVSVARMFALPDGTLERHPDRKAIGGNHWVKTEPNWFTEDPEDNFTSEIEQALWELTVPALFSLSLMHTKNVVIKPVDPPPVRNRRAAQRRGGRPFVRHHELIIDPMAEVLEKEGNASGKGLPHAVHTCRGHFKHYGEDSKLFGRYTGSWWWSEHRRGNPELGEITHSYRVELPGFGTTFRRAPDSSAQGTLTNTYADALEAAGISALSPKAKEPAYDVGWETTSGDARTVWVALSRPLSAGNEEVELLGALAELAECRTTLESAGHQVLAAVLVENEPDDAWSELLSARDVAVLWPETFAGFIEGLT